MKLLLEKLSRYWQLRFLAVSAGVVLVVYAVVLPVHSNDSVDNANIPVTAPIVADGDLPTFAPARPATTNAVASQDFANAWLGQNRAAVAQLNLAAETYRQGDLPTDFSESVRDLRKAAEQGSPVAQFLLGHAYQMGIGVPKDMTETVRWYARAGEARSGATASSEPAPKDFSQAFEAYRQSAEQGNASAELYLGLAYDLGRDVPRSASEAAVWYRKAAAGGKSSAEGNLGVLYHNGDGMPKDSAEAAVWFTRAAARGNANAQYSLGRMYLDGDGVAKNYSEAAGWLGKAANQGNAPAQVLLSTMYASGHGVPGDTAKAYMWINLASASEETARRSRDKLENDIPPEQIAEGQKLSHDWLAQRNRATR